MARRCERCSAVLSDDDQFCGECGLPSNYESRSPSYAPMPSSYDPPPDGRGSADSGELNGDGEVEVAVHERPVNYTEVSGDPSYDPLSNGRLFWQFARQAAIFAFLYAFADMVAFVVCLLLAVAGMGFGKGLGLWEIISTLAWIGLWCVFLFLPVPALLGQHSRLLRLRAPSADAVLTSVRESIVRHETPADSLAMRNMTPPGEGSRTYVELRRGVFCGMVSSFPFGRDLYVGWTFWIHLSPFRWVMMFIGRKIQNYTGRGSDFYQTLRFESARAMIGAIHSSLEEVTGELVPDGGTDGGWPPLVPRPAPPVRPSRSRA
jgi:hypothetical protein